MWIDNLVNEYEQGRKNLHSLKKGLTNSELDQQDKKQINSMIRDMSFSLEWMKLGKMPGNLRGIDRRSIYQRRVLLDMDLFPSLDIQPDQRDLTEQEKEDIIDVLSILSHRERQCFLLHIAYSMSMSEIEKELGIKKPTVQKYIERARHKINLKVSCHTDVI